MEISFIHPSLLYHRLVPVPLPKVGLVPSIEIMAVIGCCKGCKTSCDWLGYPAL